MLWLLAAVVVCLAQSTAVAAPGAKTLEGFKALDFISGFPKKGQLSFSFSEQFVYVLDDGNSCLYKFDAKGGTVTEHKEHILQCYNKDSDGKGYAGIALDNVGNVFITQKSPGKVFEVNANTGKVMRQVARLPGATAAATDLKRNELYVAAAKKGKSSAIYRFRQLRHPSHSPRQSLYARLPGTPTKMAIAGDGTIYATVGSVVYKVPYHRKGAVEPSVLLDSIEELSAIAIGPADTKIVVSNAKGEITTINTDTLEKKTILSDGSEISCLALGPDGCYYATLVEGIIKLSDRPDGSCSRADAEDNYTEADYAEFVKVHALGTA